MYLNSIVTVKRPYCEVTLTDGKAVQSGASWLEVPSGASRGERGVAVVPGWQWDGETLVVRADRYGFRNLFYAIDGPCLRVSTDILELIAGGARTTVDPVALAVFHRLGMFVGADTPFADIRVMPAGGVLTWENGRTTLHEPTPVFATTEISRDDAVDGMIHHFRVSMERVLSEMEGPAYLPLSGGRDSRHILLEMHHQDLPPERTVTFHHGGSAWNGEVKSARAISEALGQPHDVLGYPRQRIADGFRALVLTQLCADEHTQMLPLRDYFLDNPGNALDGIAGDILTNPDNDAERFFEMASRGDFLSIARALFDGHGSVISRGGAGAGPVYSADLTKVAEQRVADAIAAYADAPDPYQAFWFLHRTRREITFVPTGILSAATQVYAPYLDEDFVSFCLSLPYSVTRDQMLHDDAINRAYPNVAHIPFQEGFQSDPPIRSSVGHKVASLRSARQVAKFLDPDNPTKALRKLVGNPYGFQELSHVAYAMHDMVVYNMTADKARAMIDFSHTLEAQRPSQLVSDRYESGGPILAESRLAAKLEKMKLAGQHRQFRGRPFAEDAAHRLLLVTLQERIPQSQIFPFRHCADALHSQFGISVSEVSLEDFMSGNGIPEGATMVAFQTEYDIDQAFVDKFTAQVQAFAPGARCVYLDWFAPTDLRMAELLDPVIDAYVKKNLLADRSLYGKEMQGDTNLMDFYGAHFGIAHDPVLFPIPDGFMEKLVHGPSFATADFILPSLSRAELPADPRPIDLHARIAINGTPWYEAMRKGSQDVVDELTGVSRATGTGIRHDEFMRELSQSKICFSPFGYGEVCWRDYEAVIMGAVLIKQDMSHIESWPNIFVPMETYVPVKWDLSDFEEKVRYLLDNPEERERIATNAMTVLRDFARMNEFVLWAAKLVGAEART